MRIVRRAIYRVATATGLDILIADIKKLIGIVDLDEVQNYYLRCHVVHLAAGDSIVGHTVALITETGEISFTFSEAMYREYIMPLDRHTLTLSFDFRNWGVGETHNARLVVEVLYEKTTVFAGKTS